MATISSYQYLQKGVNTNGRQSCAVQRNKSWKNHLNQGMKEMKLKDELSMKQKQQLEYEKLKKLKIKGNLKALSKQYDDTFNTANQLELLNGIEGTIINTIEGADIHLHMESITTIAIDNQFITNNNIDDDNNEKNHIIESNEYISNQLEKNCNGVTSITNTINTFEIAADTAIHQQTTDTIHQQTARTIHQQTAETIHQQTAGTIHQQTTETIHQQTTDTIHQQTTDIINQQTADAQTTDTYCTTTKDLLLPEWKKQKIFLNSLFIPPIVCIKYKNHDVFRNKQSMQRYQCRVVTEKEWENNLQILQELRILYDQKQILTIR